MKGTVLDYSMQTSSGLISGDDGKRYPFSANEWKEGPPPTKGLSIDFDPIGGNATAIYIIASRTPSVENPRPLGRPPEYEGWYKSTDDKVLSGVCGGFAHRWNINSNVLRVVMVVLGFCFLVPILVYVALELGLRKKLPTKGVQMR